LLGDGHLPRTIRRRFVGLHGRLPPLDIPKRPLLADTGRDGRADATHAHPEPG
jgi:hypothetical protein